MPKDTQKNSKLLPLHIQLQKDKEVVAKKKQIKQEKERQENVVSAKQTKKILEMAREQQRELEDENEIPQVVQVATKLVFSKSKDFDEDEEDEEEQEFEDWEDHEVIVNKC
jgi:hypothetical protein